MAPICPSCSSAAVIYDETRGEQICTRCGLVIVERSLRSEPEWRTEPGKEAGRADVSSISDVAQHDFGLGSKLGTSDDISPSWRARLRRLQMWQRRSRASNYNEKSLRDALLDLDKLCEDLTLPKSIKAEVSALYRMSKKMGLTTGRSTWNVLAALTFLTCRLRRVPRTELEVARALANRTGAKKSIAMRSVRHLAKFFRRRLGLRIPRTLPEEYVKRFAFQLNLSATTTTRAHTICAILPKHLRQAKPATLLAAAALYLAGREAGEVITMRKIAVALGIGVSSLCQTAGSIKEFVGVRGE